MESFLERDRLARLAGETSPLDDDHRGAVGGPSERQQEGRRPEKLRQGRDGQRADNGAAIVRVGGEKDDPLFRKGSRKECVQPPCDTHHPAQPLVLS